MGTTIGAMKKAWQTPTIEELNVEQTLGGRVRRQGESQPFTLELPGGDVDTFGSIPGR